MYKTTVEKAAASLETLTASVTGSDAQYALYARTQDIGAPVGNMPQPDAAAPVAVLISAARYAWLTEQAKP